jgi:hypothetical protein
MAYREFRNEAYYAAPEIDQLAPQTMGMLETAMRIKAQKEAQNKSIQDNYKIANQYGYFPQNQNDINKDTEMAVQMMNAYKMSGGQGIPGGVKEVMAKAEAKANRGRALWDALKQKEESVKALKAGDPYYKDTEDLKLIERAYDPNLTLDEIEQLTSQLAPGKNKVATFNEAKYLDDFVKEVGERSTGVSNTTEAGVKTSSEYKGRFFDEKGRPGITDKHVQNVLERNPDAKEYYTQRILQDVGNEYKQIKAGRISDIPDTPEGQTFKSLLEYGDDNGAINYLREHPEINPINKKTEFQRISEKVKPALKEREDVHSKRESDMGNQVPNSQWGTGNKNALNASDGFDTGGPTRIVLTKTGTGENKLPYVYVKAAVKRNADTGEVVQGGSGSVPSMVKNYRWSAIDGSGAPMNLKSRSNTDLEKELKSLPLIDRLQMSAAPILNVKTLDKATVLDIAYSGKLEQVKEAARKNPDSEEAKDYPELVKALEQIETDETFDSQLIQKYFGTDVVRNELVPVSKNDVNDIGYEAATGIRPTSEKSLNDDMKQARAIIEKVKKEAQEENKLIQQQENMKAINAVNEKELKKGATKKTSIPTVSSQADYDALPSGSVYLDPEGNQRKKK